VQVAHLYRFKNGFQGDGVLISEDDAEFGELERGLVTAIANLAAPACDEKIGEVFEAMFALAAGI